MKEFININIYTNVYNIQDLKKKKKKKKKSLFFSTLAVSQAHEDFLNALLILLRKTDKGIEQLIVSRKVEHATNWKILRLSGRNAQGVAKGKKVILR